MGPAEPQDARQEMRPRADRGRSRFDADGREHLDPPDPRDEDAMRIGGDELSGDGIAGSE